MSFEAIVDDGRRTLADGNSSPWAYGSGELKQEGQEALNRSPEYTDQKSNI